MNAVPKTMKMANGGGSSSAAGLLRSNLPLALLERANDDASIMTCQPTKRANENNELQPYPLMELEEVPCCSWRPFCLCSFSVPLAFAGL